MSQRKCNQAYKDQTNQDDTITKSTVYSRAAHKISDTDIRQRKTGAPHLSEGTDWTRARAGSLGWQRLLNLLCDVEEDELVSKVMHPTSIAVYRRLSLQCLCTTIIPTCRCSYCCTGGVPDVFDRRTPFYFRGEAAEIENGLSEMRFA